LGAELAKLALGKDAFEIERLVVPIKPMPLHAFWRVGVAAKLIELRLRDRFGI
jgi:hypothetical protein